MISLFVVVVVLVGCTTPPVDDGGRLEEIAKCLTEKGAVMYGAVWCSHCKKQKEAFGEAFEYITYVECDPNTDLEGAKKCVEEGIEGVPAWDFSDGTRKEGKRDPEELALIEGC